MSWKRILWLFSCALLVGGYEVFVRPFLFEPVAFFSFVIPSVLCVLFLYDVFYAVFFAFIVGLFADTFALELSVFTLLLPLCVWGASEISLRILTNRSQYVFILCAFLIRCIFWIVLRSSFNHIVWSLFFDLVCTAIFFTISIRIRRLPYRYGRSA